MKRVAGFTLIDLMIALLIMSILSAIAIPAYRTYVMRGYLVSATNSLAAARAQMEQWYQDNRTYLGANSSVGNPCYSSTTGSSDASFNISCSIPSASSYTITATGTGQVAGYTYKVDQDNSMSSTTPWGNSNSCWIVKKGQTSC
jgi:type IV pilus assembly protein PilE